MRERRVVRPVLEDRPAARVVGADRVAVGERVLADRADAVRPVVGAVLQRGGDAVGRPRAPAVDAAAEELEGHHVHVGVDHARDLAEGGGAAGRVAGHVGLGLGVVRAAVERLEGELRAVARRADVAQDERAAVAGREHALGRRAARAGTRRRRRSRASRPTRSGRSRPGSARPGCPPGSAAAASRRARACRWRGSRGPCRRAGSGRGRSPACGSARPSPGPRSRRSRRRRSWRRTIPWRGTSARSSRWPGRSGPAPARRGRPPRARP